MKAFLAGISALAVLAAAAWLVLDLAAVDSATGFRDSDSVHAGEP